MWTETPLCCTSSSYNRFFVQGDMKIMYYELIKMLIAYEKQSPAGGGAKAANKELFGRLQMYLNQRFLEDVDTLKRRTTSSPPSPSPGGKDKDVMKKVGKSQEVIQDNNSLEARLKKLEENQLKLQATNKELKETNFLIMEKLTASLKFHQDPNGFQVKTVSPFKATN